MIKTSIPFTIETAAFGGLMWVDPLQHHAALEVVVQEGFVRDSINPHVAPSVSTVGRAMTFYLASRLIGKWISEVYVNEFDELKDVITQMLQAGLKIEDRAGTTITVTVLHADSQNEIGSFTCTIG